MQESPFFHGLM